MMDQFGEIIKFIREDQEVLLKLNNKKSAILLGIWLTSRRIDYKYMPILNDDDMIYNPDEDENEYLFWINKDDWKNIKGDINWKLIK